VRGFAPHASKPLLGGMGDLKSNSTMKRQCGTSNAFNQLGPGPSYRRSRSIRKARGTEEARISNSAGAAARAKNASEAAAQMDVANVVKPMGLKISVAGNSFIVNKNTRAAPDRIPGSTRGSVTEVNTLSGVLPNPLAASSILGLTCNHEVLAAPTAGERKSTT